MAAVLLSCWCSSALAEDDVQLIQSGPIPNRLALIAQRAGVVQCLHRMDTVGKFLGVNEKSGIALFVHTQQADQQVASVSLELPGRDSAGYASATFAPNQANGCGFDYEAVTYHSGKCEAVAEKEFKGAHPVGKLKKDIISLDIGNGGRVFLMPAGSGCVSIKKEVFR